VAGSSAPPTSKAGNEKTQTFTFSEQSGFSPYDHSHLVAMADGASGQITLFSTDSSASKAIIPSVPNSTLTGDTTYGNSSPIDSVLFSGALPGNPDGVLFVSGVFQSGSATTTHLLQYKPRTGALLSDTVMNVSKPVELDYFSGDLIIGKWAGDTGGLGVGAVNIHTGAVAWRQGELDISGFSFAPGPDFPLAIYAPGPVRAINPATGANLFTLLPGLGTGIGSDELPDNLDILPVTTVGSGIYLVNMRNGTSRQIPNSVGAMMVYPDCNSPLIAVPDAGKGVTVYDTQSLAPVMSITDAEASTLSLQVKSLCRGDLWVTENGSTSVLDARTGKTVSGQWWAYPMYVGSGWVEATGASSPYNQYFVRFPTSTISALAGSSPPADQALSTTTAIPNGSNP
jgi:hypothetical protein